MSEQKKTEDDIEQSKRLRDIAREVEADDDQEGFERAFTKIAAQKSSKKPPPKKSLEE